MFHRWHLIPQWFKKTHPATDGKCWRCNRENADWMHMWWKCEKLQYFWNSVHSVSERIVVKPFPKTPREMLLCDFDRKALAPIRGLLTYLMVAATVLIATSWRSSEPAVLNDWMKKVRFYQLLGKFTAIIDYCEGRKLALVNYCNSWKPYQQTACVGEPKKSFRELLLSRM